MIQLLKVFVNIIPLSLQVLKLIIRIGPSSEVVLNKDILHVAPSALLKLYQNDTAETNPYQDLRSYYGKFYSFMHDGIQKFAKELNGAYVRTLSSSTTSTISLVPWSLTEIPMGSLNAKSWFHT